MGKYRLLFVLDSLQIGGAEKSTLELARRLTNFDIHLCILYSSNSDLASEFEQLNIPIESLNLASKAWWYLGPRLLSRYIRKNKIDIVHANLFKSEIITRLALFGVKSPPNIGSFVNDSYARERFKRLGLIQAFKLSLVKLADRLTASQVTHFTSITNHIAETNAKALAIPSSKITVIYRGRDKDDYPFDQPDYVPGKDHFKFVMVARLLERKGYFEMIEAARILKDQGVKFEILAAGDGHDRMRFENYAEEKCVNDRINFLGKRNDVPELLNSAHAFLFPSHYEGQGGALVEAMFSAKPIIATDIPVFREQVTHLQSAVLFQLGSSMDLADKMKWIIDNYEKGKAFGTKAREQAVENFDINSKADELNSFYLSHL